MRKVIREQKTKGWAAIALHADSLLKLLRYPKNVLLLFFGLLALLAALGYLLLSETNASIRASERERQGLAYIDRLRESLQHVQQHRGMALAFDSDDEGVRAKQAEKQSIIDQTFLALDGINQRFGVSLAIGDRLEVLDQQWAAIKAGADTMTASENFEAHSNLAANLIALHNYVVDASGLIQEPSLDGYYMVDLIGVQLPALTERIGQLRAIGAHAQADGEKLAGAHLRLVLGLEKLDERSRRLGHDLRTIFNTRPDLKARYGGLAEEAERGVTEFARLIRQLLGPEPLTVDAEMIFESGTRAIDNVFAINDYVIPALDSLLQSRIEEYREQRLITIGGMVAIMLVIIYLLTARIRLEHLVERRTRDLLAMNRELEAFSYSVSHDLRAPLRAINAFSQILGEEEDRLSDEARGYLDRIRASTLRMAQLIDGLLELAKIHRSEIVPKRVDLSAIARDIASGLRVSDPERQVEFEIASGLAALGDPKWLRVLLQNLLENAWKFTAHCPAPRIEFGAYVDSGGTRFFVRDNGAGFDERFSHKLFRPFERLHDEHEFGGTGIGLATVRRIVERHGGHVWAEGAPGKGATFYFSLPTTSMPSHRRIGPHRD